MNILTFIKQTMININGAGVCASHDIPAIRMCWCANDTPPLILCPYTVIHSILIHSML